MPRSHRRTPLPGITPDDLWAWHTRPGAFERLVPPWQRIGVRQGPGPVGVGKEVELRISAYGVGFTWRSTITEATPPAGFVDVTSGFPLSAWRHVHGFLPLDGEADGAVLDDDVTWDLWGPARLARGLFARDTARLLAFRHRTTAEDLAAHARHADKPRLTVGITGASGLVGTALSAFLTTGGHRVVPFVRRDPRPGEIRWDPARGVLDPSDLRVLDAVVHLAGEPIAGGRWTEDRKRRIRDSRVGGTALLADALARAGGPRILLSGSAVGVWGDTDHTVDEDSPPGTGFLADVGRAWEAAADPARAAGLRVVHPRLGIVQSGRGGMLATLGPATRWGLGAVAGSGRQGLAWVGLDDVVGVLHEALLDDRYVGPVAVVAPEEATNATYTRALGRVLGRPVLARTPASVVRLLLGELGEAMILGGQRVRPARLTALGYRWRRPTLDDALRWELGRFAP